MKKQHIPKTLLTLAVIGILLLSNTPIAYDFIIHQLWFPDKQYLTKIVHEPHWDIIYVFGEECPDFKKAAAKQFEEDIVKAIQLWLQPLRELNTEEPIVNDFRFQQHNNLTLELLKKVDLVITDSCRDVRSSAGTSVGFAPHVNLGVGTEMGERRFSALVHELGHTFGLGDTYVGRGEVEPSVSKGGLNNTIGTQPASAMALHLRHFTSRFLGEDDKNGIIWLYKVVHDGLDLEDCLFSNYAFEMVPDGCVPKWPLIFEIRQGHEQFAIRILDEDLKIEVNAQNAIGYTALHYAVTGNHGQFLNRLLARPEINVNLKDERWKTPLHYAVSDGSVSIVEKLLEHKDILTEVEDNMGRTPLDIARESGNQRLIELLEDIQMEGVEDLAVIAKMKLATTWASFKRR